MKPTRRLFVIIFSTAIASILFAFTFGVSLSSHTAGSSRAVEGEERESMSAEQRYEDLEGRWRFEFDQLKDPRTGTIPRNIREQELLIAQRLPKREQLGSQNGILNLNTYTALGPNNLGGRTRAIAYDKLDASILLAGGVSSGIFRTTNGGTTWTNVTPSGHIHSVTTIAEDPRAGFETTWYYGTGEALGNSASAGGAFYLGFGIFKSTDNGVTWTKLTATASGTLEGFDSAFDVVHKIVVDPTSGNVYAAIQRVIRRSTNGGTSWSSVLGEFGGSTANSEDIVVTSGGRFYAAFDGEAGTNSPSGLPASTAMDGVWTSTTGAAGSWTKIAGTGSATTPVGWNAAAAYGRVVMALAPSNEDILYILYNNFFSSSCGAPGVEADFFKWTQTTTSGVDRTANLPDESGCSAGNDPFAIQDGYDLVVAVKPDDENFVVIGGTNAYRSTDGFATTGATTRIGGYAGTGGYAKYTDHHPDIHALVFHPTTSATLLCGDDGGIQRTTSVTGSPVVWTSLNNDYVTYQYYHVALDPTSGSLNAIGGTQDNGTTYTTGTTTHTEIFSGDGVAVGISSGNTYHYVGFQSGPIYRRSSGDPSGFGTDIKPTGSGTGIFVTYFYLNPDNTEHLYYASSASLYRTTSASTVTTGGWTSMTGVGTTLTGNVSVLATSRGTYTASHKLYIGTADGKVYRLNDPASTAAATVPANITGASMPAGANVSGIAVDPSDDKKVMVTFSNYGISSIWYTDDASVATPTWTAVEGTTLSLPSIRSCAIVNRLANPTEYYVGTSVGLYSTTALSAGTTSWVQEGSTTIKYAVTRTLALRPVDNRLLLGTHGNGMFYTTIATPLPIQLASFTGHVQNNGSVILEWRTISELNNYGFFVERKRENEPTFSELPNAFIPGHGTTNEPHDYSYVDATASYGTWQYRLRQVDLDGSLHYTEPISVSVLTGVSGNAPPTTYQLFQNYPNPFNPSTMIRFTLAQPSQTLLRVFDVLGREVATLVNEKKVAGQHGVEWAPANLPSGVYYCRLEADGYVNTQKLVLLK